MELGTYRHWTGSLYNVVSVGHTVQGDGTDEIVGEEVVIYHALYESENYGHNHYWVRSIGNFLETITVDGIEMTRFEWIEN